MQRKTKKNVHLRFLSFENSSHAFFNDQKSIFQKFKMYEILKKSEISQPVLQKCITFRNDFPILGKVKMFVCSSPSISTPNFLQGPLKKGSTFMIAFDHNLILIFSNFCKNQKQPIFYANLPPDMLTYRKKSYSMTIGTEKQKKCTSQIFDF